MPFWCLDPVFESSHRLHSWRWLCFSLLILCVYVWMQHGKEPRPRHMRHRVVGCFIHCPTVYHTAWTRMRSRGTDTGSKLVSTLVSQSPTASAPSSPLCLLHVRTKCDTVQESLNLGPDCTFQSWLVQIQEEGTGVWNSVESCLQQSASECGLPDVNQLELLQPTETIRDHPRPSCLGVNYPTLSGISSDTQTGRWYVVDRLLEMGSLCWNAGESSQPSEIMFMGG